MFFKYNMAVASSCSAKARRARNASRAEGEQREKNNACTRTIALSCSALRHTLKWPANHSIKKKWRSKSAGNLRALCAKSTNFQGLRTFLVKNVRFQVSFGNNAATHVCETLNFFCC